jgi:hypothetical protein
MITRTSVSGNRPAFSLLACVAFSVVALGQHALTSLLKA